jgi:hypothetical protein
LKAMIRAVACVVAAAALLGSAPAAASVHARPTSRAHAVPLWVETARRQLAALAVKAAGSMRGYSREQFGVPWADVDDNGCRTRDEILRRDLKGLAFTTIGACSFVVTRGVLDDPYTGKRIAFVRGVRTSSAVQIDHVVALADAWRTGAAKWVASVRLAYANDPQVLLAVDGPANGAKGDSDAAEWLPPRRAYDCRYVARQVGIKLKYRLWVTRAERDAIAAQLGRCS